MHGRWLLYSYDALGLGHVRRMLSIARAVLKDRQDLSALLVTCSPQVDALPVPPGLDYMKLPSARKVSNHCYVPRTLRLDPEALREMRAGALLHAARSFEPALVLVDKSPLGLMDELRAALEHLKTAPHRPRLVLGWRDILDAPENVHREWLGCRTLETIDRFYDEIWVYGDPAIFDVREAYALPRSIAERVHYVGYLAPGIEDGERERLRELIAPDGGPLAVVTVGGGEDGDALVSCYLEAARRGMLPPGLQSFVVTGPFMNDDAQRRLRAYECEDVTFSTFYPGLDRAIAAADVVISMAGYNTACEILGAGTPAVMVPRMRNRAEQRMRAECLARRGLVEYLEPESLDPQRLAQATRRALARGRLPHPPLRLNGLEHVAQRVRRLLPASELDDALVPVPARRGRFAAGGTGETP